MNHGPKVISDQCISNQIESGKAARVMSALITDLLITVYFRATPQLWPLPHPTTITCLIDFPSASRSNASFNSSRVTISLSNLLIGNLPC